MADWVNITAGDDAVDAIAVDRLASDLEARDEALRTRIFPMMFPETIVALTSFVTVTGGAQHQYITDPSDLISIEVLMKTSDGAQQASAQVRLAGGTVGATVTSTSTSYERKVLTVAPSGAERGSKQEILVQLKTQGGGANAFIKTDLISLGSRFSE